MITFVERYFKYEDPRGSIQGLINSGSWREVNLITSSKNSIRGDHYHKETIELFIILEGEIEVISQRVVNNALMGNDTHFIVRSGDVFMVEPFCNHIFVVREDSKWINMLSEPIDKVSPDIHRVQRN